MKNFLFAVAAGCISALAVTNADAQESGNIASIGLPKHFLKAETAVTPDNAINMDAVNSEAIKDLKKSYKDLKKSYHAVKDFKSSYKEAPDAKWYKFSDGFQAEFTFNGIDHRIFYDNGGKWVASLKRYTEDKLAGDILNVIKSNYPDYKINNVSEIETTLSHGIPTYIVNIESGHNAKLVRVSGEDMDVYQEFTLQ